MEVILGKIPRGSYFCFGEDPTWKLEVILGKIPRGSYFGKDPKWKLLNPTWKLFWVKCQVEVILGKIPFEVILGKIPSGS